MPKRTVVEPQVARHRAMGQSSRSALLQVLAASTEPLDAHVLAEQVTLHVNTVRWHLGVLVKAGLVRQVQSEAGRPGRPRHAYSLVEARTEPDRYTVLAEVLVDAFARRRGDPTRLLELAGRERGRSLVSPNSDGSGAGADAAIDTVVELLRRFGFDARRERARGAESIAMTPCPFGAMGASQTGIVCPVHLGLMRGVLDALEAPVEAASLEPFVTPSRCVAKLDLVPARRRASGESASVARR